MWPTPDTQVSAICCKDSKCIHFYYCFILTASSIIRITIKMSMCWQPSHRLLYSGSVAGKVHAWDIDKGEQRCCLQGHTDIVMKVLGVDYLDNIVSGSLDTNIHIWDSYTEQQTAKLRGHKKGVNSLSYNSNHRFLISSGFEPDVYVWSPFVSTLLYKLRGHRAVRP